MTSNLKGILINQYKEKLMSERVSEIIQTKYDLLNKHLQVFKLIRFHICSTSFKLLIWIHMYELKLISFHFNVSSHLGILDLGEITETLLDANKNLYL